MSSKRTTCDMRAKGTGAGCMDFSLLLHQPTARTKARRTQGKRELDEPPRPTSSNASTSLAPWTRVAAGNMGRLWLDIITLLGKMRSMFLVAPPAARDADNRLKV